MRARATATLVLTAVALTVSCGGGGEVDSETLTRALESTASAAAEGALLADGVADGRTTGPFVRVHARELAETARAAAHTLEAASAPPRLAGRIRATIALATRVGRLLDELRAAPADATRARRLAAELRRASQAAGASAGAA